MADGSKNEVEHTDNITATEDHSLEKGVSTYDKYRTEYDDDDRAPEARGRDVDEVAREYWLSPRFLGSMAAIGLGFCGGTGILKCLNIKEESLTLCGWHQVVTRSLHPSSTRSMPTLVLATTLLGLV